MPSGQFTHLHVHTTYSLLDGACHVSKLVNRAKELEMDALAITDHGALFGAIEFYSECRAAGIRPIIGIEAYMSPTDRRDRSARAGEGAFHLLLLALNLTGYRNLLKLSSLSYREGFHYKPRIDKEILREFSSGLICTSACLGGEVADALMKRNTKVARDVAELYLDIFGPERFFIEVQNNGLREQDEVNPELAVLASKLGVGLVGTNDVHFLREEDHFAHDCLCCISMARLQTDESRLKYPRALYLKSPDEMREALASFPEAYCNTSRIAGMCELELDFSKKYAPVYQVPEEFRCKGLGPAQSRAGEQTGIEARITADEAYLRHLCEEGLEWRYGTRDVAAEVRQRLEKEIAVIGAKGFCSYFLIVWDFCNYARQNNIPVGARGSGVGTMVGYLLGLCNVDPLRFGLLFERFMDPSRNDMPDIDIDLCMLGRPKVIEYVRKKYGHVAQIITFGTLAAKAAVRDVGRVMNLPLSQVDRITKLIPGVPGITLAQAIDRAPDLRELYETDQQVREVIDIGQKLEGLCRNASCHAAGVVIADQPLDELVPLYVDKDGNVLTQYEGPIVDKCGLLKMDFLGLRTLTTLQRAVELVREIKGIELDLEALDFTDQAVLDLFRRGETRGVFQFESGGMADLLMKMRPDRLEDLIAANALYRPGPMELIGAYCDRKHGREAVPQVHPIMDQILAETYGIMVYQEQVMQIFNQLGGIELASAYKLIKAISKKTKDVIDKFRPQFLGGAQERGLEKWKAQEIFELILKFGGYGFNKSHSTRYAIIAYQTAYMKTHHPVEYMAALLTYESGNTDKVVEYIEECRRVLLPDGSRGIEVLPPDVNASGTDFTPVSEKLDGRGVIRFGLTAVRGVGEKAVETIIAERQARGPFASLFDFCERVETRSVQKSTIDALIRCGAFGSTHSRRAPLLAALDRAFEVGQRAQDDKRTGQVALFGAPEAPGSDANSGAAAESLPKVPEFDITELLKFEKELLGFYLSSHPLTEQQATIDRYTTATTREAASSHEGAEVVIGCMISAVRPKIAKSGRSAGQKWAVLELEDLEGKIEAMCFADTFEAIAREDTSRGRKAAAIKAERIVFARAKVDKRRETPCLIVSDLIPVEEASSRLTSAIRLTLDGSRHTPETLLALKPVLERHRGGCDVYAQLSTERPTRRLTLRFGPELRVCPTADFSRDVEALLGEGSVDLIGEGRKRLRRLQQQKLFASDRDPEPTAESAGISDALDQEE